MSEDTQTTREQTPEATKMFVCTTKHFDGQRLWEIGIRKEFSKTPNKHWTPESPETKEASTGKKIPRSVLQRKRAKTLVLYAQQRFPGSQLERSMGKNKILEEIAAMEKARAMEEAGFKPQG